MASSIMYALFALQCILMASVVLSRNSEKKLCPPDILIFPCTCVYSTIECADFHSDTDLSDIFKDILTLESPKIRIINSQMLYLPDAILEVSRFREIYVVSSNFSSLFNDTPSADTVETFIIDGCYFENRLRGSMFSNFSSLQNLDFVNNGMRRIKKSLTEGLPVTLSKLSIREPNLHNISSDFLDGLDNLRELYIQHGNLRRLNKIKFPRMIRIINFKHNKIEYLPDGIFEGLPNLSEVVLEKNLLTTLKEEVFTSVPRLYVLRNPIMCDCKMKWLVEPRNKTYVANGACSLPFNLKGTRINQLTRLEFSSCFWKL